ncbi:DUF1853 family protein [Allomuricauda sp. d1]|uniref:DUF1853 family protein n=1 Tax=Allomuricauda sp. d1 TaxID=3136725 RepID=UPI0031D21446
MKSILEGFLSTPPLWKNQQFGLQQFVFPDMDLASVDSFELPTNLRLGHQMEYVFKHLISESQEYDVVLSNLLIEEGKARVGELDFILKDLKTKKYLHVELAYKFYIINPEISEPIYRLMGPNKRDMFHTKLDKLKEKQLPLLHHHSLIPYWEAHDINPVEIEQQCCFKAQLFEPFYGQTSIRPLNSDCISGKWIRFDDFNSKDFKEARYYIPRKLEWVLTPHSNVIWMNHFETLMEVNLRMVKENAPMLWMKRPSGEIEKLFVVWW